MARIGRWVKRLSVGALVVLVALAGLSAWLNRSFFDGTHHAWVIARRDGILLREAVHLRRELGDRVWPGWGEARLPIVAYNDEYVFLVGLRDPATGWMDPTSGTVHGGTWEPVPTDSLGGEVYYRQPIPGPDEDPQAFTVRVGDRWAASLQTYGRMRIAMGEPVRETLPWPLDRVFPYGLAVGLFMGGADGYVTLVCHESFHAFQGSMVPERLLAAERAVRHERRYPDGEPMRRVWHRELGLLASAIQAEPEDSARALARDFLRHRARRRGEARLDRDLIDYEREREWLEGLAKYVELRSWQLAAADPGYRPIPETAGISAFRDYSNFSRHWAQELVTLRRAERSDLDVRFYYSGMAQAFLLDRFLPDWKQQAFADLVWLETLLASALSPGDGSTGAGLR